MDDQTFEQCLDRRGPFLDRWPSSVAAEARARLDASAQARDLLAEARELESSLDDLLPFVKAPVGLRTRVLANLPAREAWSEWLTARAWRPVALALVPLVVGFGVGLNAAQNTAAEDTAAEGDVLLALFDPDELARFELPGPAVTEQP